MTSRSVLITGCSSGFGREAVTAFLEAGWRVVATLRNAEARGEGFALERARYPGNLEVLSLDVTLPEERAAAVRFIDERLGGRLDCLINNAGYALFGALEDVSEAQLRAELEVNFFGAALLTRALLPALRRARGRVINLSSVFGYLGMPLTGAYCASKFALEGLSESLSFELGPHGVQVALVEPGGHRTRFGANITWAEGAGPSSPYALQTERYRQLRARMASRKGTPSAKVVKVLVSLASRRKMPLRVRVGMDAEGVHWLRSLLPSPVALGILRALFAKALLRPGPALGPGASP